MTLFSPPALIKGKGVGFWNCVLKFQLWSRFTDVKPSINDVSVQLEGTSMLCLLISQSTITTYAQTCLAGLALSGVPLTLNITCGKIP